MDAFAIFDVWTLVNNSNISQFHPEVVSGDLVHLDLSLLNIIGTENDEDGIAPLLSAAKLSTETLELVNFIIPDDNSVSSEELQCLHCGWIKGGNWIPFSACI